MADNTSRQDTAGDVPTNGAEKSERILKYLEQHPEATDAEIIDALAADDVNVSSELIGRVRKRV